MLELYVTFICNTKIEDYLVRYRENIRVRVCDLRVFQFSDRSFHVLY